MKLVPFHQVRLQLPLLPVVFLLPDQAKRFLTLLSLLLLIAVGPGGMVDGKEVTMQVAVGDKVIYSKYAGTDVELDGEEYIIVKQNDILAVVK